MEDVNTRDVERQLQLILYQLSEESQRMINITGRINTLSKYGMDSELLDQIKHDLEVELHQLEKFLDFILKTIPILSINETVV